MAFEIFGYEFNKKEDKRVLSTFNLDREITSESILPDHYSRDGGGLTSIPYELLQTPTREIDLIRNYRELAMAAEVDEALQEIRNEVFIFDVPDKKAFELDWTTETKISKSIRKLIEKEFDNLYNLIEFDTYGTQWFDDWFVDSKIYFHKIIDKKNPKAGIQKIRPIDPLKIRLVRIMPKPEPDGTFDVSKIEEFYVYSNWDPKANPMNQVVQLNYGHQITGLKIHPDSITYAHSGLFDRNLGMYVGYLKKAIVPYNMLKMMEDAMLIFRVVRAPSRRAFYVDVSGLQKNKAEAYMKDLMSKFKNKMVYDTTSGTLADRRSVMSMMEDYWLPRRDGGKGTEIQTIEGQTSQEIMEEIEYLRDKLWRALGVPRGRFGENQTIGIFGRGVELQRDEYRFSKFLGTLRSRFIVVIEDLLKTQLILKKIISENDWEQVRKSIVWRFTEDNTFVESKESEILNNRLNLLNTITPYIGRFFSEEYVFKNVLHFTDKEIADEKKLMEEERKKRQEEGLPPPGQEGDQFGGFGGDGSETSDPPPALGDSEPSNPFEDDTPENPFA